MNRVRISTVRAEHVAAEHQTRGKGTTVLVVAASAVFIIAVGATAIRDFRLVAAGLSPTVIEDISGIARAEGLSPLEIEDLTISTREPQVGERVSMSGWVANYSDHPVRVSVTPFRQDLAPLVEGEPSQGRILADTLLVRTSTLANTILDAGQRTALEIIFEVTSPMDQPISMGAVLTWIEPDGLGGPRRSSATPYFQVQAATNWQRFWNALSSIPIAMRILLITAAGIVIARFARTSSYETGRRPTRRTVAVGVAAAAAIALLVVLRNPPSGLVPSPGWSIVWIAAWCLLPLVVVVTVGWQTGSIVVAAVVAAIAYLQVGLDGFLLADDVWLRSTGPTLGIAAIAAASCSALYRQRPRSWPGYGLLLSVAVTLGTMFSLIAPLARAV